MTLTESDLARILALAEKATPGPRRWELNRKHKSMKLCGGDPKKGFGRYDLTIIDFCRWGMTGAKARFRDDKDIMRDADSFAVAVSGREHHADWFMSIENPDAAFIAALDPATVIALVRMARGVEG